MATNVFINEIHYDNTGTDANEGIEIAGPAGTNLTGWSLVLYNGTGGAAYNTLGLSSVISDQQDGFGTLFFAYPTNGIQNGSPDGIALVNPANEVVQFLSYEGTFTAVGRPANGLISTDISVSEAGSEPVGQSLQLTGTGSTYENFTWSSAATSTYNNVNNGQTFTTGGGGAPTISIVATDAAASEEGSAPGSFSITRTGDTGAPLTVEYSVATGGGQATEDDYAPTLTGTVTIPTNETSVAISITPNDDSSVEGNETVVLNLVDAADYDLGASSTATITIADNDVGPGDTRIHDIQGAAHTSPLAGQPVSNVPGIVTAIRSNGFYFQDPDADADADNATSEGIFVFTSSAPTVSTGDSLLVSGTVSEFRPGGSSGTNNLSITQIGGNPTISTLSSGNPLPGATILGKGGRSIPTTVIEDDANGNVETSGTFDPAEDGIDFYESLEGMQVQVNKAVAVGPTNDFGEIPVLADNGANAGTRTTRGGIVIQPGDFNPERIIIDDAIVASEPPVNVGDQFNGSITGVIDYSFSNFKLLNTAPLPGVTSSGLTREVTKLKGDADQLTVAAFNVENLDPGDGAQKFSDLASLIANNLKSPDILSLEEVQDNNGPTNDSVVDANQTYQTLITAIAAAGGPTYEFRQVNPVDDQDGGEPGGNIRVGFLFDPKRVDFVDRPGGTSTTATTVNDGAFGPELSASPGRIDPTNSAFDNSRKPLAGEFVFNGNKVFVIGNHFNSKGGDQPLFGRFQPPTLTTEAQRQQQAEAVKDFVGDVLATDPNANVVVAGDLNDFEFSNPLETLEDAGLTNLVKDLPLNDRYTYNFEGNSQVLDHILVSKNLRTKADPEIDIVHLNTEFVDQDSDHDPLVSRFDLDIPANVIWGTPKSETLTGSQKADTIYGRAGNDALNGRNGDDVIFAGSGKDQLSGGNGNDILLGESENDFLAGDNGNDWLNGGLGKDTLTGGKGSDLIVLAAGEGTDTITDFKDGQDLIGLSGGLMFEQLTIAQGTGGNASKTLISITNNNELLAGLTGVKSSAITSADFVTA